MLEPWPTVDLTFPDLPPLPAGVVLTAEVVGAAASAPPRFLVANRAPLPLGDLLAPGGRFEVRDGRVRLPVGDGAHALELSVQHGDTRTRLRTFAPQQLDAGRAVAVAVDVPPDEIAAALRAIAASSRR